VDIHTTFDMESEDRFFRIKGKDNNYGTFIAYNISYSSLAKRQVNKMEIKKIFSYLKALIRPILTTSNLIVFTTFIMTGFIMYKIGSKEIGAVLFFAAFLYILFNKIESMDRRIKKLEEK